MAERAVVLASGGLDSTTCMAVAASRNREIIALSFSYGQRHSVEVDCARKVAAYFNAARHLVFDLSLFRTIGGSALTADIEVPKDRSYEQMGGDIPITYVPSRNLIFLSYAVAVAETAGAHEIYIGTNAVDYSGYPDCRDEFIRSFAQTANLATRIGVEGGGLRIETPLQNLSKGQIVALGQKLGAPYHLTITCYDPVDGVSCGHCDSCRLRLQGFAEAGVVDPIPYLNR